jgi:hypothetical protein
MALTKCSECGKDVSENATACPFCGNPIKTDTIQNISLTKKKWKIYKIVTLFLILTSFLSFYQKMGGLGSVLLVIGVLVGIYASIGAWWTNG